MGMWDSHTSTFPRNHGGPCLSVCLLAVQPIARSVSSRYIGGFTVLRDSKTIYGHIVRVASLAAEMAAEVMDARVIKLGSVVSTLWASHTKP